MKTFFTLIALCTLAIAPAAAQELAGTGNTAANIKPIIKPCTLVYSEQQKAMVSEDSTQVDYSSIIIKSLPPLWEDSIPVKIILKRGCYALTKSAEVSIPMDFHVYLEDVWNEKNYNLNSSKNYTFRVWSTDSDRFVLHIDKPVSRRAIASW